LTPGRSASMTNASSVSSMSTAGVQPPSDKPARSPKVDSSSVSTTRYAHGRFVRFQGRRRLWGHLVIATGSRLFVGSTAAEAFLAAHGAHVQFDVGALGGVDIDPLPPVLTATHR